MSATIHCPNCKQVVREDVALCPHCGYRIGAPLPFWSSMLSTWCVLSILLYAFAGLCSVTGAISFMKPQEQIRDMEGIQLVASLPTVALVSLGFYIRGLRLAWPTANFRATLGYMVGSNARGFALLARLIALCCLAATLAIFGYIFSGHDSPSLVGSLVLIQLALGILAVLFLGWSRRSA